MTVIYLNECKSRRIRGIDSNVDPMGDHMRHD
jgi:hypothetical protein